MRKSLLTFCICAALVSPAMLRPAIGAESSTEARLQALDARIHALELEGQKLREQAAAALAAADAARAELDKMKAVQQSAATAAVAAPASTPAAGGANGNAFNPAIAVIMNGLYAHHSLNPDKYVRAGFPAGTGPGEQGLSLGESEISFAANVDDKFYGQLTLSYEDDNGKVRTNIEEAYIDTLALPNGFNARAGRFFSNIGYLNSHHAHTDNFVDRPLAYQALLGDQYGDDGVQVRWVAPLDLLLELGGELFRGENFPSGGANHGGVGVHTLFAHAGGDVGTDNSWLAGVSALKAKTSLADDGFSGDNSLYIADATWKWAPNGNTKDGGVTLRSEYFLDRRHGAYTTPGNASVDLMDTAAVADPALLQPWVGDRRGVYLESVYRLNRSWDLGYRFDKLWAAGSGPFASDFDPVRHSLELTWRNSEFSFFRLQYSHDDPTRRTSDNAIYLQYDVSLGAHGAHTF